MHSLLHLTKYLPIRVKWVDNEMARWHSILKSALNFDPFLTDSMALILQHCIPRG
jgi:hypothetical protein